MSKVLKLKEGTPVWYVLGGEQRIGYFKNATPRGSYLVYDPIHGDTITPDCYAMQTSEYIEHVMIPDGWMPEYSSAYLKLSKIGDQIKCLVIKAARNPFWEPTQYCPNIEEFAIIKDSDVALQQQTLTHCERLNLLKELEA